jgi:TniQ/Bacterial regulatory helix-turn-helix protein, lysR family
VTVPRTFPIRLAPLPGEALDSWLESLAHRLNVRLGDVLGDLGLAATKKNHVRVPAVPIDWTIALRDEEAAGIAHATGAEPQQLHDMTLMRFDGRALRIDQEKRQVSLYGLWGRGRGSRFCPECLADSGGRWLLSWRLGWSFACLVHRRLLADRCPDCGRVQREQPFSRHGLPIPGRCGIRPSRRADPAIPAGCGQDLTRAETLSLPLGHPALAAQRLVLETIEPEHAGFGPYAAASLSAMAALSDLRAVAARILADLPADDLPRWVPQDLVEAHLSPDPGGETHGRTLARPGYMAPARATSAAAAVTGALRVLGQPDIQRAGIVMRDLVESMREGLWGVSPANVEGWGRGISPVLRGVYLAALHPSLRPSDQLRHRTALSLPTLAMSRRTQTSRRACKVPALLWPFWAVRLSPPDGAYHRTMAAVLSSAVLLVGSPMDLDQVATTLGSVTDGRGISRILQLLAGHLRWEAIAAAVTRLADYLDDHDVPIDYDRRRRLDYSDLLRPEQWLELCRRTGVARGFGRRGKVARCMTQARAAGRVRHAARQVLTEEEFRHRYGDLHQSLYDIANETSFSRQTLTRLATEYGIALREGRQDYKRKGVIGRDWLLEQYVGRGRTLPDLAREKNMSISNMARWAYAHHIPLRPRGGASHDSFLRTRAQAADLPGEIRKALTSEYAWQRLKRFAAATRHRTMSEAAEHLGITQPALSIQISRLERDIGGPLLERAGHRRPMKLTPLGEQVLAAFSQQELARSAWF